MIEQKYLQNKFLDLMKNIDSYAEVEGTQLQRRLIQYMQEIELHFSMLETYLSYYPDRIYKNMYETRLLYGTSS